MYSMNRVRAFWTSFPLASKGLIVLSVGLLVVGWLFSTPAGLLGKADSVGYAVCHRIDLRSFHVGDRATPLCARCSGMYLGAVLGLGYQAIISRKRGGMPGWGMSIVLGLFVLAFGIDGVNSYLKLFPGAPNAYEPQNWLRLLTGTGMGLGVAAMIYPSFNQTVWQNYDPTPALNGRSLALLILLALLLDAIVLTGNPLVLYPLALVSALGVLILLSMVYTMVWLMALRYENRFQFLSQLVWPILGGFAVALLQIAALDFVRYLLTGTWDGFHIG